MTAEKIMADNVSRVLVGMSKDLWGSPLSVKINKDCTASVNVARTLPASGKIEMFTVKVTDKVQVGKISTAIWSVKYIPLKDELDLQF